jgi:single-stranded-DNA-specific exonuclease
VHPLIAQIWRSRLPKFLVIVANDGYEPGRVHFSARSGPGMNVIDFLRGISLPAGDGDFGHGHDQASGGILPTKRWNALLAALGFPASVFASTD